MNILKSTELIITLSCCGFFFFKYNQYDKFNLQASTCTSGSEKKRKENFSMTTTQNWRFIIWRMWIWTRGSMDIGIHREGQEEENTRLKPGWSLHAEQYDTQILPPLPSTILEPPKRKRANHSLQKPRKHREKTYINYNISRFPKEIFGKHIFIIPTVSLPKTNYSHIQLPTEHLHLDV